MMGTRSASGPQVPSRDDFLKLPDEQKTQVNDAFNVFDVDRDGRIDYHEFRFALRALGFDLPKPDTYAFLTKHAVQPVNWDPSRECGPVFREFTLPIFQAIAGTLIFHRDPVEECRRAFRLFDSSGRGMITVEDLRRVVQDIGQNIEENELSAMIREFDSDGKGGVNEDEFVRIMMRNRA
ncbi:hypothetical protein GGTG_01210 [Gaeumannomyces tritici R3-111a-1]|uniref:Calmodulin n=1 Tax=Gaeumannomyces tritici (strain R3-111a-1) TaxID=644352 RepID=J3NIX6_GAET3|nr:hypothetical protein GGTG_01210 [Gaeumannomyces tritici R3-111a-1]EJT81226.1 hypothetical protein GGTG_01210 [Gaeumannomyces tritici R3-111a-1]